MYAGNDVIAISSLGGASSIFWLRILKGRPQLHIHVQSTLFVYLDRFRRYSTFLFCWNFSTGGRNVWGFWNKMTPKTSNERKHFLGGHFLTQTASIEPMCVKLSSFIWPVQVRKEKMQGGRKKSQEVYISRMRGATPSGRIPTKLGKCVRLTDVIKLAKVHRYNLRCFGAVFEVLKFPCCHTEPRPPRLPHSRWWYRNVTQRS